MRTFLIAFLILAWPSSLMALVRTPEEIQEHFEHLVQLNIQAADLPKDERIQRLGRSVVQLSQPSIFPNQEAARPVYEEAQLILLTTPGHAYYYRDLILKAKDKGFANGQPANVPGYHDYTLERMYALETLSHLPSLETMEVLNGFLDDTDRPSGEPGDIGYFNDLALTSITTFRKLIEEDARKDHGMTWKQWRDAVRAGELTFHFKGSKIRYNFEGPVPEQKTRPPRSAPSSQSPSDPSSRTPSSSTSDLGETSPGNRNIILAIATLILLSTIAWWGYTKRKT